jgi:hypothetical protein
MNKQSWLLWSGITLGMVLLILDLTSFTPAEGITRSRCEADSEFIPGEITLGKSLAGCNDHLGKEWTDRNQHYCQLSAEPQHL